MASHVKPACLLKRLVSEAGFVRIPGEGASPLNKNLHDAGSEQERSLAASEACQVLAPLVAAF
jgi:hypothetical protein